MFQAALAAIAGALVAAPPAFHADGRLPPGLGEEATAAWVRFESITADAGLPPVVAPRPVVIQPEDGLEPALAGAGRPGVIGLRPGLLPEPLRTTLRHETAHQFLWQACPAASGDRLFHEAFALVASGELAAWADGPSYASLAQARDTLARTRNLDGPTARRALARLLSDAPTSAPTPGGLSGGLPRVLARRLSLCESGTRWPATTPAELAGAPTEMGDALVVLSRHSGEVLTAEGAARTALPFGSTLKPFLVAGAKNPAPRLFPKRSRPEWACGATPTGGMDVETALLRSCNGYFLDWAQADPTLVALGGYGEPLLALGLSALPRDAGEAIGIRPTLTITPLGLAQGYRLLAEARPDLLAVLRRNAREGTLSGLDASPVLSGLAAKTGTVRDLENRPSLGWIAAVDDDLIVVRVRQGRAPRTFAQDLVRARARFRSSAQAAAQVQVLGLLRLEQIEARCDGLGLALAAAGPQPAPHGFAPLEALLRAGKAICLGGDWMIRFPGMAGRRYAGIFELSPLPRSSGPSEAGLSEGARRARRGSEIVFRTTRLLYTAGVIRSEDAEIRGEARAALARVVDQNVGHSRHPDRPVCDTTHCQVFQGTAAPREEERRALRLPPLPAHGWLLFSRGGVEPWRERREVAKVEAVLGAGAAGIHFGGGRVRYLSEVQEGEVVYDESMNVPCEALRGPLKLPSCPERAWREGSAVVFEGRGQGHGQGLDLESAKKSGLDARTLLRQAYGFGVGF